MKEKGIIINHKTVMKLMKVLGLKSIIRVRKYKSYRGEHSSIAPNILERNFKADQPNRKWATDVTEFNVSGNKLYLSPITFITERSSVTIYRRDLSLFRL